MQKLFIITAVPGHQQNPAAGFTESLEHAYIHLPTYFFATYLLTYLLTCYLRTYVLTCHLYTYQPTQKRFITAMPDNQRLAVGLSKSLE